MWSVLLQYGGSRPKADGPLSTSQYTLGVRTETAGSPQTSKRQSVHRRRNQRQDERERYWARFAGGLYCLRVYFGGNSGMDLSRFLRQTVKTQVSLNGELSHGIVT